MIDIHNHIIYSVDDGSQSIEQSVRMMKAAWQVGVTDICFTPHYMEDGYRTERRFLEEKVATLERYIASERIPIKLYLGEEIFIYPTLAANLDKMICLNDSRYILVELPLVEEVSFVDDVFYQLFSAGKVPILAHPERYMVVEKDFTYLENLAQKGVLLQMNLNSLVGHYGKGAKKNAIRMLKKGMVDLVGSDAHSSAGYEMMEDSLKALGKYVRQERLNELLEENPRKVLQNKEIEKVVEG